MSQHNTSKSVRLFTIALIAPFLVWLLLRYVASLNPPSFDPNPWIQSLVQTPSTFELKGSQSSWVQVSSKDGELFFNSGGELKPIEDYKLEAEKVIFAVHAQGPSLAKKYYDFLKDKELLNRSLTLSSSDGFLKDLRFHDPNLTLGCGQAYIVRWRALKQIGLEHMMTIAMSGVWLDPKLFSSSLETLSKDFTELHVPVFIGPVTTEEAKKMPTQANILIF